MASSRISYAPQLPLHLSLSPLLGEPTSRVLSTSTRGFPRPVPRNATAPRKTMRVIGQNKPLPAAPPRAVAPNQIIGLLKLLEGMEDDIAGEVQRVRESIKEAHVLVQEYKEERRLREERFKVQCDNEHQETKGVDDDFWLGV